MCLEATVRKNVPAYHFLIEHPIQSFYLLIQMQIKLAKPQMPSLRHKFNYNKSVTEFLIWMLFCTYIYNLILTEERKTTLMRYMRIKHHGS